MVKQFQNGFQKQEIELSKQEMELFSPFQSLEQQTKKLKKFPHVVQWTQNGFQKQEMELLLPLSVIWSKIENVTLKRWVN